ncbi:MAG: glycosyltransferase family 4 protein [Kiritimatiellae bacterium]|nr:glycosyltransferase family 4 protein [Kiritimatiellia bacterium]
MSRILFITTTPDTPWVGSCQRVRQTIDALLAAGNSVDLLCVHSRQMLSHPALTVRYASRMSLFQNLPEGPSFRRGILDIILLVKALLLAGNGGYDLIHGVNDSGVVAYLVSRIHQIPYVIDRVSDYDWNQRTSFLGGRIRRFFERKALLKADAVIGNSTSVISLLSSIGRRSRACVIPDIPALDPDIPEAELKVAQERYHSTSAPLITCVGSFDKFHGLDIFFNAMPHVLNELPNAKFAVVGGSRNEVVKLSKALKRAGILAAVSFPGRLPPAELAALLQVSDVLVSPRREGSTAPIKVLDYLAANRPIVAVDTPANRSILSPDNAVITPMTPEGLAEGILRLCHFPGLGTSLSRKCTPTLQRESRTPKAFRQALRHCYDYVILQRKKKKLQKTNDTKRSR